MQLLMLALLNISEELVRQERLITKISEYLGDKIEDLDTVLTGQKETD